MLTASINGHQIIVNRKFHEKQSLFSMLLNEIIQPRLYFVIKRAAQQSKPTEIEADRTALKSKLRASFRSELTKLQHAHDTQLAALTTQLATCQADLKSLENEFRTALLIEATRQSELTAKLETASKESNQLKLTNSQLEASEARNKSLIKELNELVREQKLRLQDLSKLRQEASTSVQSRSEALKEAVADCGKLKAQLDEARKERVKAEAQLKIVAVKYREIEEEKFGWTQKMAEQRRLMGEEIQRLGVESGVVKAEVEGLRRERDEARIREKVVEDQAETIRKLKAGLAERDGLVREGREEALRTQKGLERQLAGEMDCANELRVRLEKAEERKQDLKVGCA